MDRGLRGHVNSPRVLLRTLVVIATAKRAPLSTSIAAYMRFTNLIEIVVGNFVIPRLLYLETSRMKLMVSQ